MNYFRIILVLLLAKSYVQAQEFTFDARIKGCDNLTILLIDNTTDKVLDSAKCVGDNLKFKKKLVEPAYIRLGTDTTEFPARFFIENSNMTLEASIDSIWSYKLGASKINEINNDFENKIINPIRMELVRYTIEREKLTTSKADSIVMMELGVKSMALGELANIYTNNFIEENSDNFLSLYTLNNDYTHFGLQNTLDLIAKMPIDLRDTPTAKTLVSDITKTLSIQKGVKAPIFTLKDTDGNDWNLEKQKGKLVFLNFWASWCGPCRAEHPDLVEVFKKYGSKNIQFVSLSIDDDEKNWVRAIAKDKLSWLQLIDTQSKETKESYGVYGIPANFLIDENGIILKKDFSIAELDALLSEKFSK